MNYCPFYKIFNFIIAEINKPLLSGKIIENFINSYVLPG